MTTDTPLKRVVNFTLDRADEIPIDQRAALYRDIAVICGDEFAAKELNVLAAELDNIGRRHRQLLLRLQ